MTPKEIAAQTFEAVRKYVAAGMAGLDARIAVVEAGLTHLPAVIEGARGEKGADGDAGRDGRDGKNGIGERGDAGRDGRDGRSLTVDDVRPLIEEMAKAIPAGKDGRDLTADDVMPMVERMVEARCSAWQLDFERRAVDTMQRAVDRLPVPKDGRDGIDGFGFEDVEVDHDGERGVTVRFVRGDRTKEFKFEIPCVIDRGFWRDGQAVAKGDGVTFGGSYWIAQNDTVTKPEIGNVDFRLAVKRGRDGKDASA